MIFEWLCGFHIQGRNIVVRAMAIWLRFCQVMDYCRRCTKTIYLKYRFSYSRNRNHTEFDRRRGIIIKIKQTRRVALRRTIARGAFVVVVINDRACGA